MIVHTIFPSQYLFLGRIALCWHWSFSYIWSFGAGNPLSITVCPKFCGLANLAFHVAASELSASYCHRNFLLFPPPELLYSLWSKDHLLLCSGEWIRILFICLDIKYVWRCTYTSILWLDILFTYEHSLSLSTELYMFQTVQTSVTKTNSNNFK